MTNKCPECGIEIDDHPAGRCLDRWIVEQVFGLDRMLARHNLRDGEIYYHWGYPIGHGIAPFYSSDIAAAWDVVEKFRGDPLSHRTATSFVNAIADTTDANQDDFMADVYNLIMGLNPLTICRAAIKAVAKER